MKGTVQMLVIWQLSVAVFAQSSEISKKHFLLTIPKILLSNTIERACVSLHNVSTDGVVKLELRERYTKEIFFAVSHEMRAGMGECIELAVPDTAFESSSLSVVGNFGPVDGEVDGYSFESSADITIKRRSTLTFIQTDKYLYKPGQTVKFRILRTTAELKPQLDPLPEVWVEDPAGVRISQWLNVISTDGIFEHEMELCSEPTIGVWSVKVNGGGDVEVQSFEVGEYVLPTFDVVVIPPQFILLSQDTATWTICANYTYGKPVQGNAVVNIKFLGNADAGIAQANIKINGCITVEGMIRKNVKPFVQHKIEVTAEVTADGNDEVVKVQKTVDVHLSPLNIKFESDSLKYFKLGLPYYGQIKVATPDGKPVAEIISMCLEFGWSNHSNTVSDCQILETNQDGLAKFSVTPVMDSKITKIHIKAESLSWGEVRDHYDITNVAHVLQTQPKESLTLKTWLSPSGNYLQIRGSSVSVPCHREFVFVVQYNEVQVEHDFHYQVISRGNIIQRGTITPPRLSGTLDANQIYGDHKIFTHGANNSESADMSHFEIRVPISPAMAATSKLLVYYARGDGEVISDAREFSVDRCLDNEVNLLFSSQEARPGDWTNMRIQASPNSVCGVSSVDKSVHLLRSDNQITLDKVFKELSSFNIDRTEENTGSFWGLPHCRKQFQAQRSKRHFHYRSHSNYFDAIEAFNEAGMLVISDLTLETRPCTWHRFDNHWFIRMGGWRFESDDSGMPGMPGLPGVEDRLILSGRGVETMPMPMMPMPPPPPLAEPHKMKSQVEIRNYFPETWLWELQRVGENGYVDIQKELPHTITEWVTSTACLSHERGLGLSPVTTIRTFQPFFVTYALPYSVKRGEAIPLIVSISNYLEECLPIKLMLEESESFSIVSSSTKHTVCLCGDEIKTHRFIIRPKALGEINITVHAYTTSKEVCSDNGGAVSEIRARDAITKPLLVKAEGFPKEEVWGSMICPKHFPSGTHKQEIDVFLPETGVIPDSARAFVSIIGDLMGSSLEGLDNLIQMPTGCGEQNMIGFVPNIFVLRYLKHSNQLNNETEQRILKNLKSGYQNELNYKHSDGSYSAFGKRDNEGSMWLTAFVVKSFAQAKPFVYIDEKCLQESVNWIVNKQLENGCFPAVGKIFQKSMKGGLADSESSYSALTAYILIALLEAGLPPSSHVVSNAFLCLKGEVQPDMYTTALSTYAAVLADRTDMIDRLRPKLDKFSTVTDNMQFWQSKNPESKSLDVEISGYALLALVKLMEPARALKVVRWLTQQRNSHGGFVSTQDTVIALQAMSEYASLVDKDGLAMNVSLEADEFHRVAQVARENRLVMQSFPLTVVPTVLDVTATGDGCALLQTVLRYNVEKSDGNDAFAVDVRMESAGTASSRCKNQKIHICARYQLPDGVSNMAIIEVNMISGFVPHKKSLEKLMLKKSVKLKRWDVDGDVLNLYFDELTSLRKCFNFEVSKVFDVEDVQAAIVKIYDYYQPELFVSTNYSVPVHCLKVDDDQVNALPEISEDDLIDLEASIIQDLGDLDLVDADQDVATTTSRPPSAVTDSEGNRVPVIEIVPPPVKVAEMFQGDESKDGNRRFQQFRSVDHELDFPDGVEGPATVSVPLPKHNSIDLASSGCPICVDGFTEEVIKSALCQSEFAFAAKFVGSARNKVKFMLDLSAHRQDSPKRGSLINVSLPTHCSCSAVTEEPVDKVVIFSSAAELWNRRSSNVMLSEGVTVAKIYKMNELNKINRARGQICH